MGKKSVMGIGVLVVMTVSILTGCNGAPSVPTKPPPASNPTSDQSDQSQTSSSDYLDDLGCFPLGCELPTGMKELCQAYEAGNINWPGSCTDMPGQACQTLCQREKTNAPSSLPMTTVDGYLVGWREPVQLDGNIDDDLRPEHGWVLPTTMVDTLDNVLLWYGLDLGEGQFTPNYYRFWDGEEFSPPLEWTMLQGPHKFDSANNLHIITNENYGEENATLVHIVWDGTSFTKTALFPDRLVQPFVLFNNLDIDEADNLHLTFQDKSKGVLEVWYTRYDGLEWSEPVNLSHSSENSVSPALAVGKDGMVYLAWHEEHDDAFVTGQTALVMFTIYDGEAWSEPTIAPMTGTFVDVEADKRGFAMIHSENKFVVWDGAEWEGPYEVEYPGEAGAMYHRVTEDNGQIHFMWNRYHEVVNDATGDVSYQREVCYRKRMPDGTWSPVFSLGTWSEAPTYAEYHSLLEVDSKGVVHTAFGANLGGMLRQYYTNSGAEVEAPELLTQEVYQSQLVDQKIGKRQPAEFSTATHSNWSVEVLSNVGEQELRGQIAVDSKGVLHTVWQRWEKENLEIFYNSYDGMAWGNSTNVSQFPGYDTHPVITVDSYDQIHVAWIRWAEGTSSVFWSTFDGDIWSTPVKLSKRVTWKPPLESVAMIQVEANVENALRPSLASGPDGTLAMSWSHSPEGYSTSVSTAYFDGERWTPEEFPGADATRVTAADWSSVDIDDEGQRHLTFISSGMMDEDSFLFAQPFHVVGQTSAWSEAQAMLSIPADTNPFTQMTYKPVIKAVDADRIFAVFSMRPFERENFPYRLDTENSNAYLVFWDGSGWSDPRRLDPGDAFGPSYVDMQVDHSGITHMVWAKYDTYAKRYSIYYTTSDGYEESEIVLLWQADEEQEAFPILKPDIDIGVDGSVHVLFAIERDGVWGAYYYSKP